MTAIKKAIVTGLGTGYLPIAPGTWGSGAVACIFFALAWGLRDFECRAYDVNASVAILAVLSCVGCVALGRFTEKTWGTKDPGPCTIDEWAGQSIAYIALPLGAGLQDLLIVTGAGFFAFRLLDIVKPYPARRLEKLPFGWGVLLDDIAAGIYANIACQLILRLWLLA